MEECNNNRGGELQLQSLSSRSIPQQHSPSFRRRESKGSSNASFSWIGSNRLVLWLVLVTLWAYLGFFVQSKWDHYEKEQELKGFDFHLKNHQDSVVKKSSLFVDNEKVGVNNLLDIVLAKKRRSRRSLRSKLHGKHKRKLKVDGNFGNIEEKELEIPLVGPFGSMEDKILKLSTNEKGCGKCDKKSEFAQVVMSKSFVLIFHELSMTGAPLSMMELATELLSCGANVSAVVLSRKGGLMQELVRRQIKVIDDKVDHSFKTSMNAHLVIAGSAVCASWIEQYIEYSPAAANHVVWWIMENRREYFDRSKDVLNKVRMLIFLSELQSKKWQKWCDEESIKLRLQPAHVPLSVNDKLAFSAGLHSSSDAEKIDEKRKLLRASVRRELGLNDNDMLVISLSSINPGKGQLLFLESAKSVLENESFQDDNKMQNSSKVEDIYTLARRHHLRKLLPMMKDSNSNISSNTISSNRKGEVKQSLKILIGSVGSKSNKVEYVKSIVSFLSQHSNLSKSVLWTPATTHVASLYSAADVYVINSQGLGETFGRVTIEAMAFGLPVLGTDGGGTKEIVEHNVSGLLHPIRRKGNHVLAQNLEFLLENRLAREQMGMYGRKKVQRMYLKEHMYSKFVEVLVRCMRIK
ncbi:putative glycosyl transferase, family 1 [Medicago truncatula]|uniref:Group 1 family glycosyltransferase n=1 Tax=Medicago truncatula TaxID=3880 RepID=G7JG43_MEDTR|nr:uncharacterized protein LOC11410250 [Medicago truncatula]AES89083.1 group 1 family glycosyltransferase [Medicago truncatula]RHN61277.1 putative glycosyl transferase, family 1 [Medicago truncatula]